MRTKISVKILKPTSVINNDLVAVFGDPCILTLDGRGSFHICVNPYSGQYSKSIRIDKFVFEKIDSKLLCDSAKRSLHVDNAGGKSAISEAFSIYYFEWIRKASNFVFETEVDYWVDYKMVDFICSIDDKRVGVSVTRAMGFPSPDCFTYEDALKLLRKKLYGLIVARNCVSKKHSFFRSVLHIWCQSETIASHLRNAYASFDQEDFGLDVAGNVLLLLTVCDEKILYFETKSALHLLRS